MGLESTSLGRSSNQKKGINALGNSRYYGNDCYFSFLVVIICSNHTVNYEAQRLARGHMIQG